MSASRAAMFTTPEMAAISICRPPLVVLALTAPDRPWPVTPPFVVLAVIRPLRFSSRTPPFVVSNVTVRPSGTFTQYLTCG